MGEDEMNRDSSFISLTHISQVTKKYGCVLMLLLLHPFLILVLYNIFFLNKIQKRKEKLFSCLSFPLTLLLISFIVPFKLFSIYLVLFFLFYFLYDGRKSLSISISSSYIRFYKRFFGLFHAHIHKKIIFPSYSSTNYISVAPIIKSFCNINEVISMRIGCWMWFFLFVM